MLTDEEIQAIEREIQHSEEKRGACVGALQVVQRHRGWVSDECLEQVAHMLDMTPDELDGVATFYSLIFREPVGRHVILVCDCISCWILGYEALVDHLRSRLGIGWGETTTDGRFTLLPVACLGACDHAPAMMVDDDLHTDMTVDKLDEILASYS
jgi:NADH-quinone oxidoreductase subunit E